MKQKIVDKVVMFYKFWSATLLVIFIFLADYRIETFYIWWISTVILMMYLLVNILYLVNLKKKLSEDRIKELIHFLNNSHKAIHIDKKDKKEA